jgi:hypothetical protein
MRKQKIKIVDMDGKQKIDFCSDHRDECASCDGCVFFNNVVSGHCLQRLNRKLLSDDFLNTEVEINIPIDLTSSEEQELRAIRKFLYFSAVELVIYGADYKGTEVVFSELRFYDDDGMQVANIMVNDRNPFIGLRGKGRVTLGELGL